MSEASHLNLILIGDSQVGKTSILYRKMYGKFDPNEISTIGVS